MATSASPTLSRRLFVAALGAATLIPWPRRRGAAASAPGYVLVDGWVLRTDD